VRSFYDQKRQSSEDDFFLRNWAEEGAETIAIVNYVIEWSKRYCQR